MELMHGLEEPISTFYMHFSPQSHFDVSCVEMQVYATFLTELNA